MRLFPSEKIRSWLAGPRLPVQLAAAAVLLTLPSLWIGFQMDDLYHRMLLLGKGPPGMTAWQIFSGADGTPELHRSLVDQGVLPWWTSEGFRLSLFRPLSVLTARVDYWLWPDSPLLMHAQNLLWFGALIAAVALLYRRLMAPAWLAGLAALLYAIDDAHAPPASWIANRNALLACFFGVLCLIAHDRWRRDGRRLDGVLAPLCLAAALASGEAALATVGYLVAYAVVREESESWTHRMATLMPAAAVSIGWQVLYRLGNYGAHGSGLYIDPVASPLRYVRAVVERAPLILLGQWTPLPSDLGPLLPPELESQLWWLSVGVVGALALLFWPLCRRQREARFWLLGMALSLLPIMAVFPSNRLLFFVGLGAMALLGSWLAGVWSHADWLPESRAWRLPARVAAVALVIVHLPVSIIGMPLGPPSILRTGRLMEEAAATLPADGEIFRQELVLVNAPDYLMFVTHIPTLRILEDRPPPLRVRALSTGPTAVDVARLDASTLRLRLARGLYAGPLGWLFRDRQDRFEVGDRIEIAGLAITISELNESGDPREVIYAFDSPLDDRSRRWMHWVDGGCADFEPPAIGESRKLEPAHGPLDLFY